MKATRNVKRCVIALLAVTLLPASVSAQSAQGADPKPTLPLQSFEDLGRAVKLGDTVKVIDNAGGRHDGIVADLSPSSIVMVKAGRREEIAAASVDRIMRNQGDPLWDGAVAGLAIGAGAVLVPMAIACANASYCSSEDKAFMAVATGIYGGIGAAIGTGLDALFRDRKTVYRRTTGAARTFAIAPMLSSRKKGVAVSFAWGTK